MKKKIAALALIWGIFISCALATNNVSEMSINVLLNKDGSASITQEWVGDFDEGTENYIPLQNMNDMTIENFTVSDGRYGLYENQENWNVKATKREKTGKSGVLPVGNGYELCWGIGDYGQNSYKISYDMTGSIISFTDYDGFNIRFVNSDMSTFPTKVNLKIFSADGTPLNTNNAAIWAFGYDGSVNFDGNGGIIAKSNVPLNGSNHMTVMVRLDKGIFAPTRTADYSFSQLEERALEDSDYEDEDGADGAVVMFLVILAIFVCVYLFAMYKVVKNKNQINRLYKSAEYFRDIPQGGNIEASVRLAKKFRQVGAENSFVGTENTIVGATILRLINGGNLMPITEESTGFMGRTSEKLSLQLVKCPLERGIGQDLYNCFAKACGDDGILQEKELEKWCSKNYRDFLNIVDGATARGDMWLKDKGCFTGKRSMLAVETLTDIGKKDVLELMGLKKYLLEFSLIKEKGVIEVHIWQDYLVYAMLMGIGDRVVKQMKNMYPEYVNQPSSSLYYPMQYYYMANSLNRASYIAARTSSVSARGSGSGGSASFGGGGGFSGGGSGGGSR